MADFRLMTSAGDLVDGFTAAPYAEEPVESVSLGAALINPHRQRARNSEAGVPDAYVLEESISNDWERRATFFTGRPASEVPTA